ncbi:-dimethylguanosine trna methyltransferase [Plasmopara halstedii]|uniref:tRNA (guanine(26)-N(2))-dimethyltransferase n=1 Tax=Plasmopara halstedii TaxID=4781 RepID=A0A0P1A562_PLAHL|nr:-dimethylguanosine trna methyltransferase [Plasmopara halstedii]CEG35452.1 -dimethylguanosine trna methyltransferase [Plasmopara halstedii]|eukprot:XP_024571821.1 -dimethylguanosine trna methyltransferase [Plasmopara halstedii]
MSAALLAQKLHDQTAPPGHKIIREGNGVIIFPEQNQLTKEARKSANAAGQGATFTPKDYTDEEIETRLVATAEENGIRIFEALSASGLRSIRYFQQIPGVKSILVNDMDPAAAENIKRNIALNNLPIDRVVPNEADATDVMYNHRKPMDQFDVIDLDPYGSASTFLDSAVQSVTNGGLLCVTCTDMPVLSGKQPEICFARYQALPNKSHYLHEMALRMVLQTIESSANRYARHIVPIASCSIDFYVRLFVRVFKSPVNVKKAMTKLSYVFQCVQCESFHLQPLGVSSGNTYHASRGPIVGQNCDQCNGKYKMAGPIWSAPLHNRDIVLKIRDRVESSTTGFPTKPRLHGLLTTISEELVDAPLHYTLPGLCKVLHCSNPRMSQIKGAIRCAGYEVSQFHKVPEAIKTTAPNDVIWDIMRCWVKKHPLNKKRDREETPGSRILIKAPKFEANFSSKRPEPKDKVKALRFPLNPEPNWGPKARAVGKRNESTTSNAASADKVNEAQNHRTE